MKACAECEASLEIMMSLDLDVGYYRALCNHCSDHRTRRVNLFEKCCQASCIAAVSIMLLGVVAGFLQDVPMTIVFMSSSVGLWGVTGFFAQLCAKSWC